MIRINSRIDLDENELDFSFIRASGPGGQNVNKVSSAVRLRFDVLHSPSLPNDVRHRLIRLAGRRVTDAGELIITAQIHRSQERNRQEALEKLIDLIQRAAVPPVPRRPTRPTAGSRKRRLEGKSRRSHDQATARRTRIPTIRVFLGFLATVRYFSEMSLNSAGAAGYKGQSFDNTGRIESWPGSDRDRREWAVRALGALAHDSRLQVHRLLVRAGDKGLSAGAIAEQLDIPCIVAVVSSHASAGRRHGAAAARRPVADLFREFRLHECADGVSAGELLPGRTMPPGGAADQAAAEDPRLTRSSNSELGEQPMDGTSNISTTLPVAVIGAGPVGLAAAAQLATRGQKFILFESGPVPAAAMREWGHVTFFSPWRYTVDDAARALLEPMGWTMPDPDRDPTGRELVERYLVPLAGHPAIAPHLRFNARVIAVSRRGMDRVPSSGREERPFEIITLSPDGRESRHLVRAVIDASGTWRHPNPAGGGGVPAEGERAAAARLSYGIPDVVGATQSSASPASASWCSAPGIRRWIRSLA